MEETKIKYCDTNDVKNEDQTITIHIEGNKLILNNLIGNS